jgi:hypothetical protein
VKTAPTAAQVTAVMTTTPARCSRKPARAIGGAVGWTKAARSALGGVPIDVASPPTEAP